MRIVSSGATRIPSPYGSGFPAGGTTVRGRRSRWHAAAAGRAAWKRHPGAPRIDASSSRRAAAAPLRPRLPGRRPVARSGHPWRALQRAKPARAMDGVRFRAGASLRACFGLREARQDGEPSQVEAIQGERRAFRKPFLSPGDARETRATGSTRLTSRSSFRPLWKKCHWPDYPNLGGPVSMPGRIALEPEQWLGSRTHAETT
jgi:hypothetical protein